jgi:hypothetical protein
MAVDIDDDDNDDNEFQSGDDGSINQQMPRSLSNSSSRIVPSYDGPDHIIM